MREATPAKAIARGLDDPASVMADLRVLVVEDNFVNQRVIRLQLEKQGCPASFANNGAEALGILAEEAFDLVFMDCQMPQMDGYEATRRLRSQSLNAETFVVALTAHTMEGDKAKCFAAGMDAFLQKPIRMEALEEVLREAVERLRRQGGAPGRCVRAG